MTESALPLDASSGLTAAQAKERLATSGPNEITAAPTSPLLLQVARRFANPLVAILVVASVASAVLGDFVNSTIIVTMVVLSIAIELVQTRRSERAADALKARIAPTATVLRDGTWLDVHRRDVVVGDMVRLSAGDLVPADAVLVTANDLHLNEAALTGESLPVEKAAGASVPMGASVVSGNATAHVVTTGQQTTFGELAKTLATAPPPTEFERGIVRFGMLILKTVVFLVLFVFVVSALSRRDPLQSLLFAVALAVGLTPEFLPMITTVTLTKGAVRMARAKVIVKNLAAIQNFGSIDILCTDKTGTLTVGEMVVERHVDPHGVVSERPMLLAYVNSFFESGVDNPLDEAVLRKGKLNPLDAAVLCHEHPDISGYRKVDEIPFDFERRRTSVVAERAESLLLVMKGAPEHVLAVSTSYETDGRVLVLDDAARARTAQVFAELGQKGFRVLAIAYAAVPRRPAFSKNDEHDLTLAGYVAFADPVRPDAREVLAKLHQAGIRVKVLTGDNELVTVHVCEGVGISARHMLLGSEIDRMTDPALAHRAERANIFARVSPAQKNRILRVLQTRGHVVGFLGDGINDAPSLHAADVGITVAGATDVAKDAADILLLEPSLEALLAGVIEGRKAFGNVMKYLLMGTSSSFGNMFSMAGAAVFLPFLPMLPTQILLNNFLYDLAQITIPSDNVDARFTRKPRKWDIAVIRRFMFVLGPVSSLYDFLTFFVLLRVFHASETAFHTGWFIESLATQTLVIFSIRTAGSPFASRPSRALAVTTMGVVLLGLALPFSPLAKWLGFGALPPMFLVFVVAATATYLGVVEIVKRRVLRRALA